MSPRQRGLTLLEVVIALLLFAMISVMLVSGHGRAADATLRAEIQREIAELATFRINMVALQPDEYEDGDTGGFPAEGVSSRLVDEEEVFGSLYAGYTWEVEKLPTIGAGATGAVSIDGSEPRNLLFDEEGSASTDEEEEPEVESGDVDTMLFIRVTVYPPGYEEMMEEDQDLAIRPRSVWTAIHLPEEEEDQQ